MSQDGERRADSRLSQPNLNLSCGDRHMIRLQRLVELDGREREYAFVAGYPEIERLNPFGDMYAIAGVKLTWMDAVIFERMLYRDPELQQLGKQLAGKESWSKSITKAAEAAVQRIFEEQYLPWLLEKFDDVMRNLCAEYTLASVGETVRGEEEAAEWRQTKKKSRLPKDYLEQPITTTVKKRKRRGGKARDPGAGSDGPTG